MRMNKTMFAAASLSALALTSGGVTDPETGNRTI